MPTEMHNYDGSTFEVGFDELLDPKDAAAALRVSVPTLALWANQGRLACTRTAGNRRRYYAESVRAAQLNDWVRAAMTPDEMAALRKQQKIAQAFAPASGA